MSKVMRSVRNVTKGYSATQVKVRDATSNDPWGPTGTQMSEIAQMTFNTSNDFYDIMDMIDKRLNDKGKNWRHVLKALKVLDYCLHEGSELVVTWARQNAYIIKTLREFQYVDEDGRDVGQNVRVAAKELTSLVLDEERLRAERSDRKSWKSRVTGLEEYAPQQAGPSSHMPAPRHRPQMADEDDAEYRLALEASLQQEKDDNAKREGRHQGRSTAQDGDDDDLAKAIQLSKEEDERRREREQTTSTSLFDDDLINVNEPQPTGANQGYQQGNQVDFFANPIENQPQPTGYMNNAYTGFQQPQQQMSFQTGYNGAGFGMQPQMQTGFGGDVFGQQPQQQPQQQPFQQQPTGFNPYMQQQQQQQVQSPMSPDATAQPGTNNPWATSNTMQQQSMQPTPTGSNNPFAQFNRSQSAKPALGTLSSMPEQKTLSTFGNQANQQSFQQQPAFGQSQPSFDPSQKDMNEHESKLNSLLATGDGMDTYGNTGNLRIPAQHTAPGTFVNSAGSGASRLNPEATGNNPFMRQQFTGMPAMNYGSQQPTATGPAGMNGQMSNNPFGAQRPQQQTQNNDLIQF